MPEKLVIPIHGEDHCPGGPDPIPCLSPAYFRAIWSDTVDDLSGTSRSIDWGPKEFGAGPFSPGWEISTNGSSVFRPRDTGGGIAVTDSERVRFVDILKPGVVTVTWGFTTSLTGDAANGDVYSMFTELNDAVWGFRHETCHAAPSGVEGEGWLISTLQRVVPVIDPFDTGSQTCQIRTLLSWSGPTTGEDVSEAFIDITWQGITATPTGEI